MYSFGAYACAGGRLWQSVSKPLQASQESKYHLCDPFCRLDTLLSLSARLEKLAACGTLSVLEYHSAVGIMAYEDHKEDLGHGAQYHKAR